MRRLGPDDYAYRERAIYPQAAMEKFWTHQYSYWQELKSGPSQLLQAYRGGHKKGITS